MFTLETVKIPIIILMVCYAIMWARTYMRVMQMPSSKPKKLGGVLVVFAVSFFWPLVEGLRYYFIQLNKAEAEKMNGDPQKMPGEETPK
jgi:hypothetical protein